MSASLLGASRFRPKMINDHDLPVTSGGMQVVPRARCRLYDTGMTLNNFIRNQFRS